MMPPLSRKSPGEKIPYYSIPSCSLYHGDCLRILPTLPPDSIDLIFADPPFNINWKYDQYQDDLPKEEYLGWCKHWLIHCFKCLKPYGSIYVAIGPKYQADIRCIMDQLFHWRNTIIWHYTFGSRQESNFTPSWTAIHYYTKHPTQFTWNHESIRVPSLRQLKYNDKRAVSSGKLPDNVWILDPRANQGNSCFLPEANSILESRVCGTFRERTSHPCQMNINILDRIIRVSSNPGDLILDPMLGSGTTAESALRNGRRCIGIELSKSYLDECCIPRIKGLSKK